MVIDCVSFNGEYDLFKLRYEMLKDYVDEFIVIEFDKTFSGKEKEPLFKQFERVNYHFLRESVYEKYRELAESSPQTQGAAHWKLEFMQKESIKDTLTHLNNNDLVFIGDVDEIWKPYCLKIQSFPLKLKLRVYTYYLNNESNEQFWGTLVAPYHIIKNNCLNHLRTRAPRSKNYLGWHFTSMAKDLHKKLTDSYTQESYATPEVIQNLAYNIENNKDFLGRNFEYKLNEENWPKYLKDNREQYKDLCKEQGL